MSVFQSNVFQTDVFQQTADVGTCVFQSGVFQPNVFDVCSIDTEIVFQCNVFQPNVFQVGAECLADYNPTTPTETTRSARGGGGAGWDKPFRPANRGSAKLTHPISEDELRDTYDRIMGIAPQGRPAKAVERALKPYLLADALAPSRGLPEPDDVDWGAVLSDIVAQQAILAAYDRMMMDEDDAITLLLLAH